MLKTLKPNVIKPVIPNISLQKLEQLNHRKATGKIQNIENCIGQAIHFLKIDLKKKGEYGEPTE